MALDRDYLRTLREQHKRNLEAIEAERAELRRKTREINIDGTDFAVNIEDGYAREWGVNLFYDPATDRGYQLDNDGRRIGLTSYAAFGDDIYQAREAAAYWLDKARRAWQQVSLESRGLPGGRVEEACAQEDVPEY